MTTFTEDDLQVTFNNVVHARRFDDSSHGLSHCMKVVDFVVELHDRYLFIEFKDPENPNIPTQNRAAAIRNLQNSEFGEDLKYKFRDTFLYEWAAGRADKPVDYFVLIAVNDRPLLSRRFDLLERNLPQKLPPSVSWIQPIVHRCGVFNIADWNTEFPDYQVSRLL